jgi:hypothetical protein
MPDASAHEATVDLAPGSDVRALGAAVTIALCGRYDHEPPCPLAPHSSSTVEVDGGIRIRVLFAAAPESEAAVRSLLDAVLQEGSIRTPDGGADWVLLDSAPSPVRSEERAHAQRLSEDRRRRAGAAAEPSGAPGRR